MGGGECTRAVDTRVAGPAPDAVAPTADAGNNWHFLGVGGELEGHKLQAVDQVHFNEDGKIDQRIIYMRPISVAQRFAEVIMQRLQATR